MAKKTLDTDTIPADLSDETTGFGADRGEVPALETDTILSIEDDDPPPTTLEIHLTRSALHRADVTGRVREAGPDASASDVLDILVKAIGDLPPGEALTVSEMTAASGESVEGTETVKRRDTLRYKNLHAGREVQLLIAWGRAMRPSDSTGMLVTHMKITPEESILDLGTGTGVIAIAAHKLGAGKITATDIREEFLPEITVNLRMNGLSTAERRLIDLRFGDMFKPVMGELYDHVMMNPSSIPCRGGTHLDTTYDGGKDGRAIIDRLIREVSSVLKPGGRLTMVHGSLSNLQKTLNSLRQLGFQDIEMSEVREFPFKDFYPVEYLKELQRAGIAEFKQIQQPDGSTGYFEMRTVLTATLPKTE